MVELNSGWKRNFDVYDRISRLGIDLGKKEDSLPPARCTESGPSHLYPLGSGFSFRHDRRHGSGHRR